MNRIKVNVTHSTAAGRLVPRYDKDSGILAVESRSDKPWSYGLNIDGVLVFDLDEKRALKNFDLHIPREKWVREQSDGLSLLDDMTGELEFAQECLDLRSLHLPIRTRLHEPSGTLRIDISTTQADRIVLLSEHCKALLAQDELVGFVISGI